MHQVILAGGGLGIAFKLGDLRVIRDGDGRSVGTARTYAGRLALYLTWAATAGVDETAVSAGQLAAFARWLERSPSGKHRLGPDPGTDVTDMYRVTSPASWTT